MATLLACGEGPSGTAKDLPGASGSLQVSPPSMQVAIGESASFTAAAFDKRGNPVSNATPTWRSDNPSVVQISSDGVVTARSNGTTTVIATWGTVSASAPVETYVTVPSALTLDVGGLVTATLAVGSSLSIHAHAVDSRGNVTSNPALGWSSSKMAVATVSGTGVVKALAPGSTRITVLWETAISASINVVVVP